MKTTLYAHNCKEGLAIPGNSKPILNAAFSTDADTLIFPDAYSLRQAAHGSRREVWEETQATLMAEGYASEDVEYGDGWWHDRHIVVASRVGGAVPQRARYGTRSTVETQLPISDSSDTVRVCGWHGSDESTELRLAAMRDFLLTVKEDQPTVVAGDANELHGSSFGARVLRTPGFLWAAGVLPSARARSLATRLVGMAGGESVALLEQHGFVDADRHRRPTMGLFQLDRFMVRTAGRAGVIGVKRGHRMAASDHRPISLAIEY